MIYQDVIISQIEEPLAINTNYAIPIALNTGFNYQLQVTTSLGNYITNAENSGEVYNYANSDSHDATYWYKTFTASSPNYLVNSGPDRVVTGLTLIGVTFQLPLIFPANSSPQPN